MAEYERLENETTSACLKRLIGMGAPVDAIGDMRTLLNEERQIPKGTSK